MRAAPLPLALSLTLSLLAGAGCGSFTVARGPVERVPGETRVTQRRVPAAGVPVALRIDGVPAGDFTTDANGDVVLDLAPIARRWKPGERHELEATIAEPGRPPLVLTRRIGAGK